MSNTTPDADPAFLARQHIMFALRSLKFLPTPYQEQDSSRITLAYFCLSALALLPSTAVSTAGGPGIPALDVMLKPAQIEGYRDWIYTLQASTGGFRGSDSLVGAVDEGGAPLASSSQGESAPHEPAGVSLAPPNVIQTYTAISALAILGDTFERLDRAGLVHFLGRCQNPDGSFSQFPRDPEPADPRSTYSAFAVASMVNDWSTIDVDSALAFVARCRRPEGGFATQPGLEPQGGATYCCVASFALAGRVPAIPNPRALRRWLVSRQVRPPVRPPPSEDWDDEDDDEGDGADAEEKEMAGFQGRIGKDTDACYSFWCQGALKLLDPTHTLLRPELDRAWLHSCQHGVYGGIAREPGAPPDVYHTYLALAALAIGGQPGLAELDVGWNVAAPVAERIRRVFGHNNKAAREAP